MSDNTQDFGLFGFRELEEASKLLHAMAENKWQKESELDGNIAIEFNPNSGNVFLADSNYNVAMLNDNDELENWVNCPNCGYENYLTEFPVPEKSETYQGRFVCPECKEKF